MFSLFKKSGFNADEFEKELSAITQNISTTSQQISRLKSGRKSAKQRVSHFFIVTYLLFITYDYVTLPTAGELALGRTEPVITTTRLSQFQLFFRLQTRNQLLILLLYPVFGYLIVQVIHYFYNFLINSKVKSLANLKKKHKSKIEELKKITNFNTTNELLNKFGDEKDKPKPKAPSQLQKPLQSTISKSSNIDVNRLNADQLKKLNINITPNQLPVLPHKPTPPNTSVPTPSQTQPHQNQPRTPVSPSPSIPVQVPITRTFQDRILDVLIGSDNNESIENRYALICYKCFTHNGLAPPNTENPATIKFRCLRCDTLNGQGVLNEELKDIIKNKEVDQEAVTVEEPQQVEEKLVDLNEPKRDGPKQNESTEEDKTVPMQADKESEPVQSPVDEESAKEVSDT